MTDPVTATAVLVMAAVLGLVFGSFLTVVVSRVPAGASVVSPASACPRCGATLGWWQNIPLLSFALLRGRCGTCGLPISWRYPAIEAATSGLWVLVTAVVGLQPMLAADLYLATIAVALTAIDLEHRRLPNAIVLPSIPVLLVLLAGASAIDGTWFSLLRAVLGGAALFAGFFLLAIAWPGGMGFGDVKLVAVLGLALGYVGWGALIVGVFAGFVIGSVVGLALIATGRGGRKLAIPFGPFLLGGALLGILVGEPLWAGYLRLMGL